MAKAQPKKCESVLPFIRQAVKADKQNINVLRRPRETQKSKISDIKVVTASKLVTSFFGHQV